MKRQSVSVVINSYNSVVFLTLKKNKMKNFCYHSLVFDVTQRTDSTVASTFCLNTVRKQDLIALSGALRTLADKITN